MTSAATNEIVRESTSAFVSDSLSPVVALITSLDVEKCLEKNNLSFAELLTPFSQLSVEGFIKDPNNQNHAIESLKLDFRDLRREGFLKSGALNLALKELIRSIPPSKTAPAAAEHQIVDDKPPNGVDAGDFCSAGPPRRETAPWYDQYRRQFTRLLEPSEHEFLRNYLACILVVSTEHPDPLDQFIRLGQAQHALQHQGAWPTHPPLTLPKHAAQPKWFSTNIFKYHLLIHDVSTGNDAKAESIFQSLKMSYGTHSCHLLRLNSSLEPDPSSSLETTPLCDPWAGLLRYRLRHFDSIRCFPESADEKFENSKQMDQSSSLNNNYTAENGLAAAFSLVNDEEENNVVKTIIATPILAPISSGECIPHPLSNASLNRLVDEVGNDRNLDQSAKSVVVRHGQRLTASDLDRLKIFVQEFCLRGLLPFVERQLRLLNDQISSRRGLISKSSLVSSARRWFTGGGSSPNFLPSMPSNPSSPEQPTAPSTTTTAAAIYNAESVEMQTRRLADLAFLFKHYEFAYHLYYSLKKEFTHAGAWLHQAGAAEMASICVFLAGPSTISNAFPVHYMDDALKSYAGVCDRPFSAIRAAIFGSEILIAHNTREFFGEAASLYIRMTAADDLSGALFLERAAWCFAEAGLYKKAALHLTLAGYRFKKGALHQHGERCYKLAQIAYACRGWKFAEGHIDHMLTDQKIPDDDFATVNRVVLIDFQLLSLYVFSHSYLRHASESYNRLTAGRRFATLKIKPGYAYETCDVSKEVRRANLITEKIDNLSKLHCRVECESILIHDFTFKSICLIPITITVENLGDQTSTVNLRVESTINLKIVESTTIQQQAPSSPTLLTLRPPPMLKTPDYLAISPVPPPSHDGKSSTAIFLPPAANASWKIYAYVCAPGVYDATSRLTLTVGDGKKLKITVPRNVVIVKSYRSGGGSD